MKINKRQQKLNSLELIPYFKTVTFKNPSILKTLKYLIYNSSFFIFYRKKLRKPLFFIIP